LRGGHCGVKWTSGKKILGWEFCFLEKKSAISKVSKFLNLHSKSNSKLKSILDWGKYLANFSNNWVN
jgi:hypothetical protein